jgi:hypothetical protein
MVKNLRNANGAMRVKMRFYSIRSVPIRPRIGLVLIILHLQLPRTLKILTKLVNSTACTKIDEADAKKVVDSKRRDVGIEAKHSVFDLSESEEEDTNTDDNVTGLVKSFCALWMESMDDPKTPIEPSDSEEFRTSYRALKDFEANGEYICSSLNQLLMTIYHRSWRHRRFC